MSRTAPDSAHIFVPSGKSISKPLEMFEVRGTSDQGAPEGQLWRHPIDGSTPTQVNSAPTLGGRGLDYFGDPLPISNGDGVLKLWSTHSGTPQLAVILLQWTPAP